MMFFKTAIVALALTLVGSVSAAPYVRPQAKLAQRDIQVLGVRHIPVPAPQEIAVRGEHYIEVERREVIAEEIPTKADHGDITQYNKRAIAAEIAVKTDAQGNIVAYDPSAAKREIAAEIAVKTDAQGNIVAYDPSAAKRELTVEVPHKRAGLIPSEIAVRTDENGNIVEYN